MQAVKQPTFTHWKQFGNWNFKFNGYHYRTYDALAAKAILKMVKYAPFRAWNIAKVRCELIEPKQETNTENS